MPKHVSGDFSSVKVVRILIYKQCPSHFLVNPFMLCEIFNCVLLFSSQPFFPLDLILYLNVLVDHVHGVWNCENAVQDWGWNVVHLSKESGCCCLTIIVHNWSPVYRVNKGSIVSIAERKHHCTMSKCVVLPFVPHFLYINVMIEINTFALSLV